MTSTQRAFARRMKRAARETVMAIRTGQGEAALDAHGQFLIAREDLRLSGSDYQPTCIEASAPPATTPARGRA